MALLHLDGFEGVVPYWYAGDHASTSEATLSHMLQYYTGRMTSGESGFHTRKSFDGKTHALGTGVHSGATFMFFGRQFAEEFAADTVITIGFRVKTQATDRSGQIVGIMGWDRPELPHCALHLESGSRKLRFTRGTTIEIGVSSEDVLSANTWHYIELAVKVNPTTGTVDVKVDDVSVLSLSGVNTQGLSNYGEIGGFQFLSPAGTNSDYEENWLLDDIYILDSTGSVNNTFLGPIRVWKTSLVDGDTDFTIYGGGRKTDNISTNPYDKTVGVTSLDTTTNEHMSGIKPFHTDDIIGVAVQSRAGISAGNTNYIQVKQKVTSSVSSDTDTDRYVADSKSHIGQFGVYGTDPNTSGLWTQNNINAAEFGVEIG